MTEMRSEGNVEWLAPPNVDYERDGQVGCDDDCGAVKDPRNLEQLARAYEHWRWHGEYGGCSHGS